VIGGDGLVAAISAASILAKVARDEEMTALSEIYPGYGLEGHVGYPTRAHIEALETLGVTPIHRRSFGPVKRILEKA
jgi:ribonuclease HII